MKFKRTLKLMHSFDTTPMVGLMFNLILFFILTSNFIFTSGIKIDLPKAFTSEVLLEDNVNITITSQGIVYLDKKPIGIDELYNRLSGLNRPVLIKVDRNSSFDEVVNVWDICRAAGVPKVNIATNPEAK